MLIAITVRIATEMTAISGSPRRAKPIAAPATRLSGVAMTASRSEPQEARRLEREDVRDDLGRVEGRPDGQRRDSGQEHQDDADREQDDGDVGDRDQQPPEAPFEHLA